MAIILTHAEYCNNKEARLNASAWIRDGKIITQYKGVYYSEKEWQETFPIEGELVTKKQKKHWKGDNPNGKTQSIK